MYSSRYNLVGTIAIIVATIVGIIGLIAGTIVCIILRMIHVVAGIIVVITSIIVGIIVGTGQYSAYQIKYDRYTSRVCAPGGNGGRG